MFQSFGLNRAASGALVASALAVAAISNAYAQQTVLRFHTFVPPKSSNWLNQITPWIDKVQKDSGGRIKIEGYPSMQLGGAPSQLFDQAKDGVVDVIWTLPGYTPGRFPRVEAFELPFMMSSAEPTSRALWEYIQTYAKDEFKDFQLISVNVHGPGHFHSRDKDIRSIADLRGMKLRGATRLSNKLLASLGAAPVGMPVTQIPDAISKGVIEGALLPWEIVPAIKLNELAKSHSEFDAKFGAIYTSAFVMLMNKAKYDSLPADLKRVIDQSSGIDESARMGRVMQEADTPGRRSAESRGNKMFMIGAAESEAFRKASDQVDDDWIKEMTGKGFNGKQLYDAARTLIQKYSK